MSVTKQVIGVEEKYKVLVEWIASSSYWGDSISMAPASPFLKQITRVVDEFDYEVPEESHEIKILTHIIDDIKNKKN
tara:strand:- start:145 stop:375 length:231 start_codon:yes stop_codon:yes gene_type:complete